jgi:trans-aconitate 2-methyltransferase
MSWNPAQYLKFHSARLRPAVDLLQKSVEMMGESSSTSVKRILDLGCGPGNITPLLTEMFPTANIHGVDSSKQMIDKANQSVVGKSFQTRTTFQLDKIESYASSKIKTENLGSVSSSSTSSKFQKYDFVYSNAALHWCVDHDELLPAIIENLLIPTNGVFALQMPDTKHQKSHLLMETAALRCGLIDFLKRLRIPRADHSPEWYFKLLSPLVKEIDIWTTEYLQQLPSYVKPTHSSLTEVDYNYNVLHQQHPVAEFTKATGLLPFLDALGGEGNEKCRRYLDEYNRLLHEEYSSILVKNKFHSNGKDVTLMPFKRLFIVCKT